MIWFDLPAVDAAAADVLILPLPFEATACYGKGTARGPAAVQLASTHVELWDEEVDCDLARLRVYGTHPLEPGPHESVEHYLHRVYREARRLHEVARLTAGQVGTGDAKADDAETAAIGDPPARPSTSVFSDGPLVVGVGGEHSLTPPLVAAAATTPDDLSGLTVVQIDAHADLRDSYHGTPFSHACAMRRVVEKGARVVAIGIRSADREEFAYGCRSGRVGTYFARDLARDSSREEQLFGRLAELRGDVYLTIDVDGLDVSLCPGTGTPQPGGLRWWQTLEYLRRLLYDNRSIRLTGCDIVETAPQPNTQVNEFTAARLLAKVLSYRCHGP